MTLPDFEDPTWNARRKELEEALLQAANELTTFTRCSRTDLKVGGIRVVVQLETFDKSRMS